MRDLTAHDPEDAKRKMPDIEVFGDPGAWVLIAKASSKSGGWMKTTKAMKIGDQSLLVQTETEFHDVRYDNEPPSLSQALTYVPSATLKQDEQGNWRIVPVLLAYPFTYRDGGIGIGGIQTIPASKEDE